MSLTLMHLQTTDAICFVRNDSDTSKRLGFNLNGALTDTSLTLVASQTADRTITFPDISGTLLTDNSSDIFLNKTITDSSNYVGADELKTTGASVVISSSAPPSAGQILKATSPTNASWTAQTLYFQAYLNVQTTFTTAPTDLPLNVEVVKNSPYTHTTNSPQVSITVSGNYIITVYASPYGTAGNIRSSAEIWLSLNTGSGFTEVAGTRGVSYVRQSSFGSCIFFERYLTLSAGNIVKVQAQRTEGTTTSVIRSGQYSMLIKSA